MSGERASELLSELYEAINGIPGSQVKSGLVLDALPEIIAVVEAAENPNALRGDLDRALDALASKLSGEGQGGQSPTDIAGAGQEGCG